MEEWSLPGAPEIAVRFRRSARAKRISLRVSRLDGQVTLTLPRRAAEREARAFLAEKAGWVRGQLAGCLPEVALQFGAEIPVEGRLRRIEPASGRRVQIGPEVIAVPGAEAEIGARLSDALKTLARERLDRASAQYAAQIGRKYNRITLRDTRSRWGSCSSAGGLMYSWRLILAPEAVLNYVAAHEVAHLQEMNHSAAFWALVARLEPDYERPRRWLRDHGSQLHRYRFA